MADAKAPFQAISGYDYAPEILSEFVSGELRVNSQNGYFFPRKDTLNFSVARGLVNRRIFVSVAFPPELNVQYTTGFLPVRLNASIVLSYLGKAVAVFPFSYGFAIDFTNQYNIIAHGIDMGAGLPVVKTLEMMSPVPYAFQVLFTSTSPYFNFPTVPSAQPGMLNVTPAISAFDNVRYLPYGVGHAPTLTLDTIGTLLASSFQTNADCDSISVVVSGFFFDMFWFLNSGGGNVIQPRAGVNLNLFAAVISSQRNDEEED